MGRSRIINAKDSLLRKERLITPLFRRLNRLPRPRPYLLKQPLRQPQLHRQQQQLQHPLWHIKQKRPLYKPQQRLRQQLNERRRQQQMR
jgi:hypothetical protein